MSSEAAGAPTGLPERTIYRLRNEAVNVQFGTADRIITHAAGAQEWFLNPELRAYYLPPAEQGPEAVGFAWLGPAGFGGSEEIAEQTGSDTLASRVGGRH